MFGLSGNKRLTRAGKWWGRSNTNDFMRLADTVEVGDFMWGMVTVNGTVGGRMLDELHE